jgi:putative ABC transport system permease protein
MKTIYTLLKGIWSQKTRTALTAISTVCAAAILTCLVAFYHASTNWMAREIEQINRTTKIHLHIMPSEHDYEMMTYSDYSAYIQNQFKPYATSVIKLNFSSIQFNPRSGQSDYFEHVNTNWEFAKTFGIHIQEGRFFSRLEHPHNDFVVIGHQVAEKMRAENPNGANDHLVIGNKQYPILGVIQKQDSALFYGRDYVNNTIFTFLNHTTQPRTTIDQVVIQVNNPSDCNRVSEQLNHIMKKNLPNVKYQIDNMGEIAANLQASMSKIRLVFCILGLVSALVAGVNICNSMYAIISERTEEIGIRLAIGASPFQVKQLLTAETGTICLLSTMIGILIGELINSQLIEQLEWDYEWIPAAGLLSFLIINLISLLSCYIPLRKINRINPIAAIQGSK